MENYLHMFYINVYKIDQSKLFTYTYEDIGRKDGPIS